MKRTWSVGVAGRVGAVWLSLVGAVDASVMTFTDESAFKAGLKTSATFDFDSFNGGSPTVVLTGDVLDKQIVGLDFDNAVVSLGQFGGTFRSGPNVVLNGNLVSPIVIRFSVPVQGVGLFNTSLADAERLEVFDAQDNLLGSVDLPDKVVTFGGVIVSDGVIAKAMVMGVPPTNGSIFIDDLTIGVVPEPGTAAVLGLAGVMGLWGRGRGQRRRVG